MSVDREHAHYEHDQDFEFWISVFSPALAFRYQEEASEPFNDWLPASEAVTVERNQSPLPGELPEHFEWFRSKMQMQTVLTKEEETQLFRAVEQGVFAAEELQRSGEFLSRRELREYRWIERNGARAFEMLFLRNQRLVISIAASRPNSQLELMDRIQEGNFGLMRAIQKFDYTLGFKFSTYAVNWIQQTISRAEADQGRTIRLPVHVVDQVKAIATYRRKFRNQTGRQPTSAEIAHEKELTEARVRELDELAKQPLSIDAEILHSKVCLGELIQTPNHDSPEREIEFRMLQHQLESLLDSLSEREAGVIRMRFGLGDGAPKTLDQIGDTFGVTRERIRQIEKKTMEKLRTPSYKDSVRAYLKTPDWSPQPRFSRIFFGSVQTDAEHLPVRVEAGVEFAPQAQSQHQKSPLRSERMPITTRDSIPSRPEHMSDDQILAEIEIATDALNWDRVDELNQELVNRF